MNRRARTETFGAWLREDERTLLAIDRGRARDLGIEGGSLWRDPAPASIVDATTRPLEAHVAVTSRCGVGCVGCYLDAKPTGVHRSFEEVAADLDALARAGIFTVAFGGGEPITHPAIGALAAHARARGLVPVTTTSGVGLTAGRAAELGAFAQINVSHDGVDGRYLASRGFDGAAVAERAIAILGEAGIAVGVNVVLGRGLIGGPLLATAARVAALGAREIQLLRLKPAGRAASLDYLARRPSAEEWARLPEILRALEGRGDLSIRIDCALVPFVGVESLDDLVALGIAGCEAGRLLSSVDVGGIVGACSVLPGGAVAAREPGAMRRDPTRVAARARPTLLGSPCRGCPIAPVCRGGCAVVAEHVAGDRDAPDPECPRVIAHARGAA
jgi:radical SAM protein with 4Fe4S-binding SPASM domain